MHFASQIYLYTSVIEKQQQCFSRSCISLGLNCFWQQQQQNSQTWCFMSQQL